MGKKIHRVYRTTKLYTFKYMYIFKKHFSYCAHIFFDKVFSTETLNY